MKALEDTPIDVLKSKIDNFVHHIDNRKVVKIEHLKVWAEDEWQFKSYVKHMLSIQKKRLIDVDTKVSRFLEDIIKMLKHMIPLM